MAPVTRPWGTFDVLDQSRKEGWKLKRIVVEPGKVVSVTNTGKTVTLQMLKTGNQNRKRAEAILRLVDTEDEATRIVEAVRAIRNTLWDNITVLEAGATEACKQIIRGPVYH